MKAYMGYSGDPIEGAVLIFAKNSKEAKKLFFKECQGEIVEDFVDARVKWLPNRPWLLKEADQEKYESGTAHIIECPKICQRCEQWGFEIDEKGICTACNRA